LLGSPDVPTLTEQIATHRRKRSLNLVIILEESLGATFVESLGGVPVTPELEKLKSQGWWFEQLYATGTRSVRGIEAVISGYAPTPAQAVVKLSLAQKNFFTLASLLGQRGYSTEFIYGGESHFDNMRGFFMGNGFKSVVDQNDFHAPLFKASWGVSDEDLLNKAHEQLSAHHASGKPFFTLVFSSSNHSPFEFPDGRISLYDKEKGTENNAVKYADYAVGQFFEKARASKYWQDTIFLIVADHDIRVRGGSLVPIKNFHIPGLILGADIEPRRIKTVASQIDLPTTLLSLMGVNAKHPMIGRDLSAEPEGLPGRAMMQFEQHYAWMEGNQVVVLRPDKAPAHALYNVKRKELEVAEAPSDAKEKEQRALAHVMLPAWLYREQRYRLPE
jgi:phosphoglycerol transferase MdoB-like AlkP superfamily enzyme